MRVDDAHGDGDPVGEVETDCGDGRRAHERDLGAEGREGEEERAAGTEDDCTDRRMEPAIDNVQSVGNATITSEGEHHAGVGSLDHVSVAYLKVPRRGVLHEHGIRRMGHEPS